MQQQMILLLLLTHCHPQQQQQQQRWIQLAEVNAWVLFQLHSLAVQAC
jgi:hypothetical protein